MKYRSMWPALGFGLLVLLLASCSGTEPDTSPSAEAQATSAPANGAATSAPAATEAPQATATPAYAVISAENAGNLTKVASWSGHYCDFNLAFSPDSQNLVSTSCDQDTKVRVWDLASNTEQTWNHEGAGFGATFSSDGSVLAVWSLGPKVILYDVATGTMSRTVEHTDYIFEVDISPDGTTIAGAGGDGTVVLWDLATGEALPSLSAHLGEQYGDLLDVASVSFSPDGASIASADGDGKVRIWDLASGSVVRTINTPDARVVKFSADGSLLAVHTIKVGVGSLNVALFDAANGSKLRSIDGTQARGFDISPDGHLLAIVFEDDSIVLYDTASGSEVHRFAGGAEYVDVVVFSPDGRLIASGPRYADANMIQVWGINP